MSIVIHMNALCDIRRRCVTFMYMTRDVARMTRRVSQEMCHIDVYDNRCVTCDKRCVTGHVSYITRRVSHSCV